MRLELVNERLERASGGDQSLAQEGIDPQTEIESPFRVAHCNGGQRAQNGGPVHQREPFLRLERERF